MKRNEFNQIVIFPEIQGAFSLFIRSFFSLILAFTNCQIKEARVDNEKYFPPNETKIPMIFFSNLTLYRIRQLVTSSKSRGDHRKEGVSNTLCLLSFCVPSLLQKDAYMADAPCFFFLICTKNE